MSNFLAGGKTYQTSKTFAQGSFVTVVVVVSIITAATLFFAWFAF